LAHELETLARSRVHLIAAAECFTTEVWTARGLVGLFTLFAIDVASRRVHVVEATANRTSVWMEKTSRNLTDCDEGILRAKRFLVIDRNATFSPRFKSIIPDSSVEVLLAACQAPNMKAYAERFVKSIKSEDLDQIISSGRESLDRAIAEYAVHYHDERSHQGIETVLIDGATPESVGIIETRERPGG
jgi:putative transposase